MVLPPDNPAEAQAWIRGSQNPPPDAVVDFYIPRGNTGAMGPRGPIGPSPSVGTVETNMGPAAPGTVGPQGLPGPQGVPGGLVGANLLYASNLNSLTVPGIYYQDNGTNVTFANNYPISASVSGFVKVYSALSNSNIEQEFTINWSGSGIGERSIWRRVFNGTWLPWRIFNSSRIDQTAGRVIYQWDDLNSREQLAYGDTGWRDITNTTTYGWTASLIWIRRINSTVYFKFIGLNGSAATQTQFTTIPSGFNANADGHVVAVADTAGVYGMLLNAGNAPALTVKPAYASGAWALTQWFTDVTWPTTLPGTAAGTIPNI